MYAEGQTQTANGSKNAEYRNLGMVGAAAVTPQSEVERLLSKLRTTAEDIDDIVSRLVGSVEKVTRAEPPAVAAPVGSTNPVASTILGRNLDDLNNKLRNSFLLLQSTAQRIEL